MSAAVRPLPRQSQPAVRLVCKSPATAMPDPRAFTKACGAFAWALYSVVVANDADGIPNTYASLAEHFDYSVRQVMRLVQKMEREGYVALTRSEGKSTATTILGVTSGVTNLSDNEHRGDKNVTAVGVTSGVTLPPYNPPSVSNDTKTKENTPPKPPKPNRAAPGYSGDFEQRFWTAYPPGHGSKKDSFELWEKLSGDDQAAAVAGLPAWKASGRWRRGYVVDAERYIKKRLWENPPPPDDAVPSRPGMIERGKAPTAEQLVSEWRTSGIRRTS